MTRSRIVRVRAFPRLHLGLLDLSNETLRRFGGSGFALDGPPLVLETRLAERTEVSVGEDAELDEFAREDISRVLDAYEERFSTPPCAVRVVRTIPSHIGLGSKTAMLLALGTAIDRLNGLDLSREETARLSRRGGASGVGVNTFFTGGFVADEGHPAQESAYAPSSASGAVEPPVPVVQCAVPARWAIVLLLPSGHSRSGLLEADFFRENTPIPALESLRAIAATYHGLVPAFRAGDLGLLREGLRRMRAVGFKRVETDAQTSEVRKLLAELGNLEGLAAGMSSLGPLVFGIFDSVDVATAGRVQQIASALEVKMLGVYRARNRGARVLRCE